MICEKGFNNTFYYFGYERKVRDWMVVRELIFVKGGFLEEWRNNRFFEIITYSSVGKLLHKLLLSLTQPTFLPFLATSHHCRGKNWKKN